jgi:hypothetical protein
VSARDLLVLYVWFECGLVMLCLVATIVGRWFGNVVSCRDHRGPPASAWVPSLRILSAGTWSSALSRRLARRGLGR